MWKDEIDLIQKTLNQMLLAVDQKDWTKILNYFTKEVYCDYSSLSGIPGSIVKAADMVAGWSQFLPGFEATQHFLSNQIVNQEGNTAQVSSYVNAIHYLTTSKGFDTWTVNGFYQHELVKEENNWKISRMILKVAGVAGNLNLPLMAGERAVALADNSAIKEKITFTVQGEKVVGTLFRPAILQPGKKYPAALVGGSWTTVKEMMAGSYAQKLADQGFITLAIDHRGFGESEGELRDYESPAKKIQDFKGAISFLSSIAFVDPKKINLVGVCASAGYLSQVAFQDQRINSIVLIAGWLHKPETVELIYGGKEGVEKLLKLSEKAQEHFIATGQVKYVAACSDTDPTAAMYGPFDYYLDEKRGKIKEWSNKFALIAWKEWLTFNPLATANLIEIPVFIIHSEEAALPQGIREFYAKVQGSKEIYWIQGNQFDFYDNGITIDQAVKEAISFLQKCN